MKKNFLFVILLFVAVMTCIGDPSYNRYVPEAHFLFSTDSQKFRESVEDIPVNSVFWIRVEVQIKCGFLSTLVHSSNARKIPVSIIISNTKILSATVQDAPYTVSPITDSIKGTTTYPFYAYASTNPKKVELTLRCKALKPGTQKLLLEYGDAVNKDHNQFRILIYEEE